MLSYMLPTEEKPPAGETNPSKSYRAGRPSRTQKSPKDRPPRKPSNNSACNSPRTMLLSTKIEQAQADAGQNQSQNPIESPKHNGTTTTRKSTLHSSMVTKDESLYSIDSDASTGGSDRKSKLFNGAKHASLKRVSFGSSKGSMVETLVYETPVQEEPEINHFMDHNGRIPTTVTPVPDTDEGREKVRVSLLGPQPSPATPGVLLLEPISQPANSPIDMASSPPELLTAHTDHTTPAYHAQISTDSGWDNPFRPDGDLSREADEIVELIKGGKPITPTPGQNGPSLPSMPSLETCEGGCEGNRDSQTGREHDDSTSPLLKSSSNRRTNASPRPGQENGNANANGTPMKGCAANSQQPVNEKVGGASRAATVEVARLTSQGPGDASQVEHVTLKKKPKCKCCVLQ